MEAKYLGCMQKVKFNSLLWLMFWWVTEGTSSRTCEILFAEEVLLKEYITSNQNQEKAVSVWTGAGNLIGG